MSAAARIDTLQNDRGLKTCFDAANVDAGWSETFCKLHKVATLDDFVYLVDSKDWESGLRDLLQASPTLKDNRIILSRFKAAYESGVTAIKSSQASQKVEENPDTVLPESTLQSVSKDFSRRYGMVLERTTDFAKTAFRYVPDYWTFRSVAETDLFKWREILEKRLDDLHDATSYRIFSGRNTVQHDMDRHVTWSEQRLGRKLSQEEIDA
eukprot:s3509_g3.t1